MSRKRDEPKAREAPRRKDADASSADAAARVPTWLPPALFVALALLLFRRFVFSDAMLYGGDTLGLGYVARAFYARALESLGTWPRWNPEILGGTPFLEALSGGDSFYPPSLLLLILLEPYRALGWKLVLHVAAAGFFTFGWVRAIGGSRAAALLGGTAYMLAPYMVTLVHPGHDGKLFVTALAPLLFWAVERHFERTSLKSVAAIALVVGGIILTTHFQMAYFLFGAVGLYATFRAVELARGGAAEAHPGERVPEAADTPGAGDGSDAGPRSVTPRGGLVPFALFLAASVLGAGVAAVQLVPAVDYVTEHSRRVQTTRQAAGESGVAWSSSWSLHPEEVVSLVIPEFVGNDSRGADWTHTTYWGRNVTRDNHPSSGLVILLLAAASFAGGARRSLRFFFAGLGAVALLFALGTHTPVWGLFYAVVPGIRLFRAPDQVMFLFVFAACTLGALGLDRLLALGEGRDEADDRRPIVVLATCAGFLGLLAALAGSGALVSFWTSAVHTNVAPERLPALQTLEPYIARGAGIAFLLGVATVGVAWARRAHFLAPTGVLAALLLLVVADEYRVGHGFVQVRDFEEWSAPDGFVRAVLQHEEANGDGAPYRMLSFRDRGQDVRPALEGIELAGGHHPNDLSRYRELIGMVGSSYPENLLDGDIRRLLNVRYVLWTDYVFGGPLASTSRVLARSQLQNGVTYESLIVEDGLPRARLVGASVVRSYEDAVAYMLSDAFDPEAEVVLAEPAPIELDGLPPTGSVRWTERTPNRLALEVTTERPALLVVADNWFPAWHATVDGADTPILRAYHTLRAVPVPAGTHTVEMTYRSALVRRSLAVSAILTLLLLVALVGSVVRERRSPGSRS